MDIGHDTINSANNGEGALSAEERKHYSCSIDTLTSTLATSNNMAELFSQLITLDLVRFRKQRTR
jgi:hypothetical protein